MKSLYIDEEIKYIGSQLVPHWIYRNFNIMGDAIVSFRGECEVKLAEMVDIEDVVNDEPIYSEDMLHFIAEFFNIDLVQAVFRQRLLITTIKEVLERDYGVKSLRSGDDLFVGGAKLSVSIATKSITSTLIHVGLNISSKGTPVKTAGMASDLSISDIKNFSQNVMNSFSNEINDIILATTKVRGVM